MRAKMVWQSIPKSRSLKVERSVRNFERCIRRNCKCGIVNLCKLCGKTNDRKVSFSRVEKKKV